MNLPHITYPFIISWTCGLLPSVGYTVSNAATKTDVQDSVWIYVFISLKQMPRGRTAGSYSNSTFTYLRNCQAVFQSGYIISRFLQQCVKGSDFSTSSPVLLTDFL